MSRDRIITLMAGRSSAARLRRYYRLMVLFSLFQKDLDPEKRDDDDVELEEEDPYFSRIRCPLCQWRPNASSRWYCGSCGHPEYFFDGCGTGWNTFLTRGLCPGCRHQWRYTACLNCSMWSLHEDWYVSEPSQ